MVLQWTMALKKKKNKVEEELDDNEDEEMEEEFNPEEPEEGEEDDKEIEDKDRELHDLFKKSVTARFARAENAVTTNQKYIKKLWDRIGKLEEDFKYLYESK